MDFRRTDDIEEALASLAELGSDAQVLAGGTDVMIQIQRGELDPGTLVHIERVDSIGEITENGRLTVGALATHLELSRHPALLDRYPSISHSASLVGGWQTQAVGTIGGNVCNASPLPDFVVGRRSIAREPDELVTGFSLDPVEEGTADSYRKVGRRGAMEVAIVGVAVRLSVDSGATIKEARVAVCSVGPVPFRATAAEESLIGLTADSDEVAAAGQLLLEQSQPIDDARATARYRTMVLPRVFESVVTDCYLRATGPLR